jgi:hypothetical protein
MQRDGNSAKRPSPEGKRLGRPRVVVDVRRIAVLRQQGISRRAIVSKQESTRERVIERWVTCPKSYEFGMADSLIAIAWFFGIYLVGGWFVGSVCPGVSLRLERCHYCRTQWRS